MYKFYTNILCWPQRRIPKILLIMKLTTVLLFAIIMQVSATSFAQRVTLKARDISLKKVFKEITKQTGYGILYQPDKVQTSSTINADFKDAQLSQVLNFCLQNQPLSYTIDENTIVIKVKEPEVKPGMQTDTTIRIEGKVIDEKGQGMAGANIKVLYTTGGIIKIDGKSLVIGVGGGGAFSVEIPVSGAILDVSYLGYKTKLVTVSGADVDLVIHMEPETKKLDDITIVSNGYQDIPKERATGSFETITNKQLNMVTSFDILSRLDGNVTSLNFNPQLTPTTSDNPRKGGTLTNVTVRGANTFGTGAINSGGYPLVVVDGVALEDNQAGSAVPNDPIATLNPNDIDHITILKDAAAASIWGARAANGVFVIVTKKGKYNQPMQISLNSNITVTQKPNLFYYKRASTGDDVGVQKTLYNDGFYDSNLSYSDYAQYNFPLPAVPGVVEILEQQKNGQITADQANAQLAALGQYDVRNDLTKYLLRNAVDQQHSINISGGSPTIAYRLSGGYDNDLNNTVKSSGNRLTLSSSTTIKPTKNLDIQTNVDYTQNNRMDLSGSNYFGAGGDALVRGAVLFDPYTRLADNNGNPLPVIRDFRPGYVDTVGHGHLLNAQYYPLNDINDGYTKFNQSELRLNLQGHYKISDALSATVIYSYQKLATNSSNIDLGDSYVARYTINEFTSPYNYVDPVSGQPEPFQRSVPLGGIYTPTVDNLTGSTLRGQLNFNKTWGKNAVSAILGAEMRGSYGTETVNTYYGYNQNTLQYVGQLDYLRQDIPILWYGGTGQIPYFGTFTDNRQHALSQFTSASYTYDNRYTISASARRDGSNVFGVTTNNSVTPFYSAGGLWNLSNESFYKVDWLPLLHLRATFGYNGNVNYSVSPLASIVYQQGTGVTGLPYAALSGITNNSLRPERSGILNLGLDFGAVNNRLSGSIEYYVKHDNNLISAAPIDPSTGFLNARFNSANMLIKGMDITLSSINVKSSSFSWASAFLFSYNRSKVTKIYDPPSSLTPQVILFGSEPILGYSPGSIWAYQWAGLSNTGKPQVYDNGKISTDYDNLAYGPYQGILHEVGSATPVYSGSFRNTFNYKSFSVSANFIYRLGYYFRRPDAINYGAVYNEDQYLPAEYDQRWQKPGDEAHTNVPAMTYPQDNSDTYYDNANINVLKGDNIRLQEVNLSYTFKVDKWQIKYLRVYGDVQNLGIVWRANKMGYDPDVLDVPQPRTYALGVNVSF